MPVGSLGNVDDPAEDAPGDGDPPGRAPVGIVYVTAAAIVAVDQAAKLAAVEWLRPADSVPLTSWLSLTWATNTGGAFGLFDSSTGLLAIVAAVVVGALVFIAPRLGRSRLLAVAVASVMGGALGNLIDRVRVGYVIDYIDLHFWPVFNIADIAITVGAGLMIIATILGHPLPVETGEDSD
ncbi:MAG: signal peptidase II [Armatimonadia bacterium]|nr:signal peptidase II [Armatimonadia bacterium]